MPRSIEYCDYPSSLQSLAHELKIFVRVAATCMHLSYTCVSTETCGNNFFMQSFTVIYGEQKPFVNPATHPYMSLIVTTPSLHLVLQLTCASPDLLCGSHSNVLSSTRARVYLL